MNSKRRISPAGKAYGYICERDSSGGRVADIIDSEFCKIAGGDLLSGGAAAKIMAQDIKAATAARADHAIYKIAIIASARRNILGAAVRPAGSIADRAESPWGGVPIGENP